MALTSSFVECDRSTFDGLHAGPLTTEVVPGHGFRDVAARHEAADLPGPVLDRYGVDALVHHHLGDVGDGGVGQHAGRSGPEQITYRCGTNSERSGRPAREQRAVVEHGHAVRSLANNEVPPAALQHAGPGIPHRL